ncbi:neuronal acetylcholine receptor subunit beta-3-like [Aplysia californica]|uniref:Neuronal acetylcholine receptor subunit beta-3-like n=1 Tax=Aplysia californica TaxID=6500 RepID=A0ABM0ZYU7_APLCA|nr:neuronal acetylcholine receptor subunit beta-3-like [Aplysia californica]
MTPWGTILAALALLGLTTFLLPVAQASTKSEVYALYSMLFDANFYNKDVRPVDNSSKSLEIFVTYSLLSLVSVDEKSQTMTTNTILELEWNDEYLSWDPVNYGGIQSILAPQKKMWIPDITVGNSVKAVEELGYSNFPVRLWYEGYIIWSPTVLLTTSCDIVVTYYPFDTQICSIQFETVISDSEELDIFIDTTDPVKTARYSQDGSWILVASSAENLSDQSGKPAIKFSFLLKRRTTFFIVNIILPTSVLALYLTVLLGFSALSVVVTATILRLHHKPSTDKVGRRMSQLTMFLMRLTLMKQDDTQVHVHPYHKNSVAPSPGTDRISSPPKYAEPLTWQRVAEVLDWTCLLLFTCLVLLTTVTFMAILSIGGAINKPSL